MTFDERDIQHVLRMVLIENKGNVITEAMWMGIEAAFFHYIRQVNKPNLDNVRELNEAKQ